MRRNVHKQFFFMFIILTFVSTEHELVPPATVPAQRARKFSKTDSSTFCSNLTTRKSFTRSTAVARYTLEVSLDMSC